MSPARLLVIDDEESVRVSLRQVLESQGYEVRESGTGAGAVTLAQSEPFDILLVDYQLPDMTGLDVIKQTAVVAPGSAALIITGNNAPAETIIESMRLGVYEYLLKPVSPEELLRIISDILVERNALFQGRTHLKDVLQRMNYSNDDSIITIVDNPHKNTTRFDGNIALRIALYPVTLFTALKRYFWDAE